MLQITISKRAAFMVLLAVLLVVPVAAYAGSVFDDVDDTNTHIDGITFMKDSGVSVGCDASNNYCPNDNVTRAQMGTFMYRLSGNDPATDPSVHAASALTPVAVTSGTTGGTVSTSDWTEVASVELTIPDSVGAATVIATFSAETSCYDGVGFIVGPFCTARILVDGAVMSPDTGSGYAMDSSDVASESLSSWEGHSFQRYVEDLGPGTYTISVELSSQGTTPPNFWWGDWALTAVAHPTS